MSAGVCGGGGRGGPWVGGGVGMVVLGCGGVESLGGCLVREGGWDVRKRDRIQLMVCIGDCYAV